MRGRRAEWLSAVQARVQQVAATGDLALVLEQGALAEAQGLAAVLADNDDDLEAEFALGWLHFLRYLALPHGQDSQDLTVAIEMFTPCFMVGVDDFPPQLLPHLVVLC